MKGGRLQTLPPLLPQLLLGGANHFPGGTSTRRGPALFLGARIMQAKYEAHVSRAWGNSRDNIRC
jgi:hypothetical protein